MRQRMASAAVVAIGMPLLIASPGFAGLRQVVDNNDTVVLTGNVHPLARAEFDAGASAVTMPMERMILTLRLTPEKQAALDRLLVEQQDPDSPNFHRWLSPEEFGERFGPSQEEIEVVTDWLTSEGFVIEEVGKGRTWINFSGVVGDVERTFHTQIHDYYVDGVLRHANAWAPAIPRALSNLVAGVVTLHSFPRKAMNTGTHRLTPEELQPNYTYGSSHYLSPGDWAIIYNLTPLYSAGYDGTGRTIGIVARTHPAASNWSTFRSTMGLSTTIATVIVNGTDPGDLGADEDGEADLDCEWSGAVAKNASVKFVVSKSTSSTDGVDLSAQYIVNNNLTDVMSTSFGLCESSMGSSENTFYNNLWSQAAGEGITSFVSSGDAGAAGCNGGGDSSGSGGLAVSGLASTPYNVAVGGTEFYDPTASTYWNTSNSTGDVSVKSYIPEIAWNESGSYSWCPSGDTCSDLWSSGGGKSSIYAKPFWQLCTGVPPDGVRDVPDWSFTAASHDGYLVETQGALYAIGGTSASSPSSAGVMAIICQKTGSRQGLANTRIYQLANAQYTSGGTTIFHDITSGNNTVPGLTGYSCTTGYDLVTGVGSMDVNALANNWATSATLFSDGFESGGWSTAQVARTGGAWTLVSSSSHPSISAHGGSKWADFNSYTSASGSETRLYRTSGIAVSSSYSSVTLTFWMYHDTAYSSYADRVQAQVSTDGTTWTNVGAAVKRYTGTTGWAQVTVDISSYAGQTIYLGFLGISAYGNDCYLDDVAITAPGAAAADFTISALPTTVSAAQGGSGPTTITTAVSSGFSNAISLSASGLPTGATATCNPTSIAAPGSGTSTLTLTAGPSTPIGSSTITITGMGGGKTHTTIVTFNVTGTATTLFSDGFEGTGWSTAQVARTAGAWTLVSSSSHPSISAHGGSQWADFNSYSASNGSETRLYRSSGFAVGSYGTVTLTFWMYHDTSYSTANDRVQAQVSTNGTTWTSVGPAISRYNGSTGWAQVSIDISSYRNSPSLQVGFLGISGYGNDCYLDDVTVAAQ